MTLIALRDGSTVETPLSDYSAIAELIKARCEGDAYITFPPSSVLPVAAIDRVIPDCFASRDGASTARKEHHQ